MSAEKLTRCRACGAPFGPVFCDLGTMAVANSYLPPEADAAREPRYPLCAVVCSDCRMVQLDHVVDAEGIFSDYAYFSSASSSWLAHAARFADAMTGRLGLNAQSFVVEVASNDGYLLRNFVAAGVPCLGIEPAANVARQAIAAGVPTEVAFLTPQSAAAVVAAQGRADLVVANNVLAHVPDINGFTEGLATLLKPQGTLSVEAPHLLSLIDGVQFDTIYHEHYAYWSLYAIERLFARHGLTVYDVEHLPTHGGSLRILASLAPKVPSLQLTRLRKVEAERGLAGDAVYAGFNARVAETVAGFRDWLARQHQAGRRVAAYGAAAKGNTFLNAAGVRAGDILAVADLAPSKQGRRLPGSHVPVVSPADLLAAAPDDILILPWNIAAEVVAQLRGAGFAGRLWTAVPEMKAL
ncbi:class I SAM-dependent methyltransferase [Paragemmobacter straminiformis]|uniref:Class I SAM-dependent methyltransferase n=1 Tax=Paragemmobacter straminiformis TaxID=2045119 RepID=A0A842I7H6_9RHOB|nr:class I SAM-dependent methyltransferase [Gemmobacter straminiformis]MBC2835810.1 class I SAM-dependent methyltransferase [Gemmobacter straminiformis]